MNSVCLGGILAGIAAVLAGCTTTPSEPEHNNDPYASLSPSDIYVQMGVQYMEQGKLEIADTDLRHALELDDDNSEAYNALGVLNDRLKRDAEASRNFQKSLALKPDNFSARNNYGRFLCTRGHYPEGMAQFQRVIAAPLYSQPWIPLTNAGLCAKDNGRRKEAEDFFRQALQRNPGFPPALLEMANISFTTRQHQSARGFLQRYQAVGPETPRSLWLAAQTELALGSAESANDYLGRLRARFPDAPETRRADKYGGSH
jgi:type IV pilus assembly protein PilF